ncbi:hypothetical protein CAEBREN_04551 [Caenorhabditis brenneri]|uniref:CX domain-containing protein n=1 Tax=Caenorhabditis brenneri TaxID=135651 RepID=G0MTT5_CAEBE|nr:hypothetical protein CAEBREN_04551 [Caenorhabditis brenneri]
MRVSLLILLFSGSILASGVTTTQSSNQSQSDDFILNFLKSFKVIQEPNHPIFFEGIAFYFYGAYIPSPERPQSCIILASHPEWPFGGSVFRNGTMPTVAAFGCHQGEACQGTKCVRVFTHMNVTTFTLVGVIIVLVICLISPAPKPRIQRRREQRLERPRRPSPRDSIISNVFLPNENRIRYAMPPGYSQSN